MQTTVTETCRLSCDGEMLGSIAGKHALVEIGVCTLDALVPRKWSVLIRPDGEAYEYGAKQVLRRPYEEYVTRGLLPQDATHSFIDFLGNVSGKLPPELIFVNPAFDFAFLKSLLARYSEDMVTVIGFRAYDITSYACAVFGRKLGNNMSTSKVWKLMAYHFPEIYKKWYTGNSKHSAEEDAVDQAKLLTALEEIVFSRA